MYKEEYRKMNERIAPSAELIQQTKRSMSKMMKKKNVKRHSARMVLAMVLVGVLMLTGAAFASGAAQRVFEWMQELGDNMPVNFEKLNELADSDLGTEYADAQYSGEVSVELSQAYYDGRQLITGVKYLLGDNQVYLGLDHELMAWTRPDDPSFRASKYEEGSSPRPLNVPTVSELIPSYVSSEMTEEQIQAFEEMYRENGEAGAVIYYAGQSDYIGVAEDVNDEICPNPDYYRNLDERTVWRYSDFNDLPAGCLDRDSLTVTFGISQRVRVIRADKDGVWVAGDTLEKFEFPFVIKRNEQDDMMVYGSFENEVYSAKAELRVSEVRSYLTIDMIRPAQWSEADDKAVGVGEGDVDYIWCYHMVYPDGNHEGVYDEGKYVAENTYRYTASINLPEDQNEIILRPYYTLSGLHEGEDIVLLIGE